MFYKIVYVLFLAICVFGYFGDSDYKSSLTGAMHKSLVIIIVICQIIGVPKMIG